MAPIRIREISRSPWLLAALALVSLMPTQQSLWIDEGTTAVYAHEPTLRAFFGRLLAEQHSETQMPLGLFSFWLGSRAVGVSEIGLRLISTFWTAVAILILWRIGVRLDLAYLPLLFACNAFVWYYGGEARPYAMQMALSSGMLYALAVCLPSSNLPSRAVNALLVSGTLLCATSMLGAVPVAVVTCLIAMLMFKRGWRLQKREYFKVGLCAVLLAVLGGYYLWTLTEGKGAATSDSWAVGLKNLAFASYELLGLSGFGPGRYRLRELGISGGIAGALEGFVRPLTAGIALLVFLYAWAGIRFIRKVRRGEVAARGLGTATLVVVVATYLFLFGLSLVAGFPFWGRHLAPVLPFLVCVVALAVNPGSNSGKLQRAIPLLLSTILLSSSLFVRFDPDHARDDYRACSQLAQQAVKNLRVVWWAAAPNTAKYYGVSFCEEGLSHQTPCVEYAANRGARDLSRLQAPELVILSKPDLFDKNGALERYLEKGGFVVTQEYMAFQVFEPRRMGSQSALAGGRYRPHSHESQLAPVPLSIAGRVFTRISKSSDRDQLSMY